MLLREYIQACLIRERLEAIPDLVEKIKRFVYSEVAQKVLPAYSKKAEKLEQQADRLRKRMSATQKQVEQVARQLKTASPSNVPRIVITVPSEDYDGTMTDWVFDFTDNETVSVDEHYSSEQRTGYQRPRSASGGAYYYEDVDDDGGAGTASDLMKDIEKFPDRWDELAEVTLEPLDLGVSGSWLGMMLEWIKKQPSYDGSRVFRKKDKSSTWMPFDYEGWKYAEELSTKNFNLERVRVVVEFSKDKDYTGLFVPTPNNTRSAEIRVVIPILKPFDLLMSLDKFGDTIVHEIRHLVQQYGAMAKKIGGREGRVGLPKKSVRTRGIDPHGTPTGEKRPELPLEGKDDEQRILHALRDIEFWTNYGDEVSRVIRSLGKIEEEEDRIPVFKKLMGAKAPAYELEMKYPFVNMKPSKVITSLRNHAPEKWRLYVKELFKAMVDEGLITS